MAGSLQNRIDCIYGTLSKGHKRLADYLKSDYEKAAFMTAAVLGKTVGVSESTVVRFATNLGFEGYPQLQKYLQELVKNHLTSIQRMEVSASHIKGEDILDSALLADIEMIKATREQVSRDVFVKSIDALNKASRIYVLGVRSSATLASFLAFYLNHIYENVVLIDTSSKSELFEQLYRIGSNDVCVAISFPRYSNQTINACRFASERGATVISITDGEQSPLAKFTTYLLVARSNMVSFVDSLVAPLSLINALIAAAAHEKSAEVYNNLQTLEEIWNTYRVYNSMEVDADAD